MNNDQIDMQVWAIPLGFKVFGQEVGDHTWVASNDKYCEGCGFGASPTPDSFYCGLDRWSGGVYTPPPAPVSRLLCQGTSSRAVAQCIGGAPYRFMGIPSQGGIVYGINGVCHTLTNRLLYPSNLTAEGAAGYWFTQAIFGTYGTMIGWKFIPPAFLVPFFPFVIANPLFAVAFAFQVGILIEWDQIRSRCVPSSLAKTPSANAEESYLQSVRELHAQPLLQSLPEEWDGAVFRQVVDAQYERHMEEIDLSLEFRGRGIADTKLSDLRSIFAQFHQPAESLSSDFEQQQIKPTKDVSFNPEEAVLMANQMNMAGGKLLHEVTDLLGPKDFEAYFGHSPERTFMVIDPRILGNGS